MMADLMDGDVAPGPALAGCVRRGRPFLLHFPLAFDLAIGVPTSVSRMLSRIYNWPYNLTGFSAQMEQIG